MLYKKLFKKISKTLELFKSITEALKIWEIEYFGLYLTPLNQSEKNSYIWLDLNNPISTYVDSNQNQLKVTFSIKHFIANPAIISDDQVRYYFFTQTCIDIRQNKITVPPNVMPMLFALILQSQIGDFSPKSKFPDYSESLIPNIPEKMKIKIQQAHASLVGNSPSAAEIEFLNLAQHLPGYGQIKYEVLVIFISSNKKVISLFKILTYQKYNYSLILTFKSSIQSLYFLKTVVESIIKEKTYSKIIRVESRPLKF